jgi:hypothetical protein
VNEARLIVLENLLRRRRAVILLDQVAQVRSAMTAQAAPGAGA